MEESQQQQQQQQQQQHTNHANTNHASTTNENADPLPETSEIQRLDADTVRRITAEQAISDLTSIVKELMDNALDAESTTIKIRLFGQGLDIIEVSDDGNGVPEGSLPYVATRHATSKIERLDDIYSGTGLTMGFRGEALFATACVSDSLVVASRTNEQELATKLVFGTDGRPLVSAGAGAESGRDAAAGAAAAAGPTSELLARKVGTTVAVVGPFGRLPARRADLVRRIKDERTKIFKLVEAYGIFNVGVSFHLIDIINNNNTKHNTKHKNTKHNNNHNHNHNTNQREEAVLQTSARSRSLEETASTLLGPVFVRGATRIEISLESYFRRQQQQQKATTQQQRDNNNNNNNKTNNNNNDDDDDDYHWGIGGLISMEPFELARQQLQSQSRGRSTSASTKHNNKHNNNKHHHKTSGGANNRVRSVQYYSINGRIVLLPKVTAILKKLWTNACTQCTAANMKPPKKPSALLAFTLPNRAFDINLSPDKKEVLFTDEDELMGILEEHVARMWSASTLASGGAGAGGSSSSHVFVDQSNSCLSKPRSKPSRVAVARVSDAGIPNNTNNTNNNDCASSCKSITEEEEGEDCEDEYDDDDDEYDDEHHKRRFAFVHDVSKAKMQHESESRHKDGRRFGRKRRSRHYDHSDIDADSTRSSSNSSSNSNCNSNSASDPSTTDAFPDPDADADATQQHHQQQHQHQQQQSLNNNNNNDDDEEEEEYPRQLRQTKLTPVVVVANQKSKTTTTTTALRPAPKPVDECTDSSPIHEETQEEQQQQQQQQQPQPPSGVVDRISDSDRLKWNEIQTRFRRRDSDEMNLKLKMDDDVDNDNDNKVADNNNDNDSNDEREPIHHLSRSVSVGGLRRSAANNKAPVTPEEDHEHFAGAEPRSGGASKSGKTTTPDTDTGCEHEHECEPPSARRSRLANLEQFSHPGGSGNGNDGSGGGSTATTRDKKRQRLSKLGALQQFAAHNPSANNADFHADAAGSSKPRRRTGTADGAGAKDDSSTTTAADTSQVKVQVAWESFVSTEDVCSRARTERLNMRKRKQELHDIRRLVKSRARDEHGNESEQEKEQEQEHPDSTNEIRTRTRTEAKSDEEEEDDDDNAGGDSFIRISKSTFRSGMKVIGQFNLGFILAICPQNHLWILDQHACDEKYNFEQLCKTTVLHVQPLIRPLPLELTPSEEACVLDHRDIFATNGFKFEFDPGAPIRHRLSLTSLPHSGAREGRKAVGFGPADVSTLCAVLTEGSSYEAGSGGTGTDGTGIYGNNAVRRHAATSISVSTSTSSTTRDNANANADRLLTRLPKAVAMFASRACRTSIMIGTALSQKEMAAIVKKLSATDSPWNCPHGRPTMRHVKNVLPLLWKDERRAAEHVALRSIHP